MSVCRLAPTKCSFVTCVLPFAPFLRYRQTTKTKPFHFVRLSMSALRNYSSRCVYEAIDPIPVLIRVATERSFREGACVTVLADTLGMLTPPSSVSRKP